MSECLSETASFRSNSNITQRKFYDLSNTPGQVKRSQCSLLALKFIKCLPFFLLIGSAILFNCASLCEYYIVAAYNYFHLRTPKLRFRRVK